MTVSADTLRLALVEETTAGTTPATPSYNLIRTTGEGLTYEVTTTNSEEMGGINRGVKDNILTGAQVNGDISFELSRNPANDILLSAALASDWGDDPLTVPGVGADDVYNASVKRTFTIEKRFTLNDTPTYDYHRFAGCTVDTLNLSITPNEVITGSYGFVGFEASTSNSEVVGSTYAQAGTEPVMTAPLVTGIELLEPAGIDNTTGDPLGTAVTWLDNSCFTGLDISTNNNLRPIMCIGVLGLSDTSIGRFEGDHSGTLYYNGDDPLNALIDQTEYALRVTCTDDVGGSYTFFMPRVSFATATVLATGTNTDVMTEFTLRMLEWQGDDYAYSMEITRSAAATANAQSAAPQSSVNELNPAKVEDD